MSVTFPAVDRINFASAVTCGLDYIIVYAVDVILAGNALVVNCDSRTRLTVGAPNNLFAYHF